MGEGVDAELEGFEAGREVFDAVELVSPRALGAFDVAVERTHTKVMKHPKRNRGRGAAPERRNPIGQVLTPLSETSIMGTSEDQDSIMCYQLPGDITRDGKPIRGGLDINPTDASYAAKIYPKSAGALKRLRDGGEREESYEQQDWDESEDVEMAQVLSR